MTVWIWMMLSLLWVPAAMIGFGIWSKKGGPQRINGFIGYRTARSMKNEETWAFAHREIGRLWVKWGWITMGAAVLCMLPFIGRHEDVVGAAGAVFCMIEMIPLIGCIVPVERALEKNFDRDGNRREA